MSPLIVIESFDPLHLTFSKLEATDVVEVQLPPVWVKLLDLSLDGLIEDAPYVGAEISLPHIEMRLSQPLPMGEIANMIIDNINAWQDVWRNMQKAMDRHGALLN